MKRRSKLPLSWSFDYIRRTIFNSGVSYYITHVQLRGKFVDLFGDRA
jgi:hypothetical protein